MDILREVSRSTDGECRANETRFAGHLLSTDDLYFIRVVDGPVKIGRSHKVATRLSSIRCSTPYEVELVALLPKQGDAEKRWHSVFRDQRLRGEWFAWSEHLAATIQDALAGRYRNVRLMPEDEVKRRYEALMGGQRFAAAHCAAHSVHGRF